MINIAIIAIKNMSVTTNDNVVIIKKPRFCIAKIPPYNKRIKIGIKIING